MLPYICVSFASADSPLADRFCDELAAYGFRFVCIDERTGPDIRQTHLQESEILLVLTSPAAALAETCAADFRCVMARHRPALCVRLLPGELDERLFVGGDADCFLPYPAGETAHPDERAVSMFIHRFYVRHLCRLASCFTPSACSELGWGPTVRCAAEAWQGDTAAQYRLGTAYVEGDGLPALETDAAYWMEKAATAGHPDALIRMGEMKLDGAGTEKNPAEALRLFAEAARNGDPRGYYYSGLCCLYGYGMMKDPQMAIRYLRAAADEGFAPAGYRLGLLYRDGIGTPANRQLAMKYLFSACREADTSHHLRVHGQRVHGRRFGSVSMRHMRQIRLGDCLFGKDSQWEEDPILSAKVKRCMNRCRVRSIGYPESRWLDTLDTAYDSSRYNNDKGYSRRRWDVAAAQNALGQLLEAGSAADGARPAPAAALIWYRRAAKGGHSGALFRLGDAYRSGRGVPRDGAQAIRLFRKCADFGNEQGYFALGVCYERGDGVTRDFPTAVTWYEQSANAGYAPAQNNLGGCYERGVGVTRDMLAAVEWYTRAAASDQPHAICRLGICYENGRGVAQSAERAFSLYEQAAEMGHAYAIYRLALCYDKGILTTANYAMAAHLYERAAMGGIPDAAYAFGLCCKNGRGVRQDDRAGFAWFEKAANGGHVQAAYEVGRYYFEGRAAVQSYERAITALRRAVGLYETHRSRPWNDTEEALPSEGMTVQAAAGDAMYLLGYAALYGLGTPSENPTEAMTWFRRASMLDHYGATTAMGDMYTYGLTSDPSGDEAIRAYERAAKGNQVDALLSLAGFHRDRGNAAQAQGYAEEARTHREQAWKYLAHGAEQGSAEALQGLAAASFFGWGTDPNRDTAHWFLRRAESRDGGGNAACLWLGDFYRAGWVGDPDVNAAAAAYRWAIAPKENARAPIHILRQRWQDRKAKEARLRAEALYRLAVLYAMYPAAETDGSRPESFPCLCAAILAGHTQALDDLARMYAHAVVVSRNSNVAEDMNHLHGLPARDAATRSRYTAADHLLWLSAYYAFLRPEPKPFELTLCQRPTADSIPPYMTAEVTPAMRADAMNHLGDCLFFGQGGLKEDRSAAVACYRVAAETPVSRGAPVCGGRVWAGYSLGWCLLNGKGTPRNPREAVRFLTPAARYHPEAAYCLGLCYENGDGVDVKDIREAVKYYRKAAAMHHRKAMDRLKELEKQLH